MSAIENISNYLLSTESSLPNVEELSEDMLDIYNKLDSSHKEAVDKIRLKKDKEKLLTLINNPKIQQIYLSLNRKARETVDKLPLRDRYELLSRKLKAQESRALEKEKEAVPKLSLKFLEEIQPDASEDSRPLTNESMQKKIDEAELMKKIIAEEEEP